MFYSAQILAKKGPLGIVWLAAHMDNRLKKTNVFEANIVGSVDSIMNPEAPLALRLSGQLLLGVVNIYKKKIVYLFEDCNDALSKMQQAFKPANVTLPGDGKAAPMQITLPDDFNFGHMEMFDDDDLNYGTFDLSQTLQLAVNSKDSLYLADDATAIFRTPISHRDEQFEIDGDEVERHLSPGPPEVLREAQAPTAQRLFQNDLPSPGYHKGDEMMPEVNLDDDALFGAFDAPPSAPPSSHQTSEHDVLTPHDDNLDHAGIEFPQLELREDTPRKEASKDPKPSKLKAGGKRKRAVQDVDAHGNPETTLGTSEIRRLIADRQPLLKAPSKFSKLDVVQGLPRSRLHVASYDKDASDDWTRWPSITQEMNPALYSLYKQTMTDAHTSGKASQKARRADQGRPEDKGEADREGDGVDGVEDTPAAFNEPDNSGYAGDELQAEGDGGLEARDPGFDTQDADMNFDSSFPPDDPPMSPAAGGAASPQVPGSNPSGKATISRKRLPSLEESDGLEEDAAADESAADSFTARSQQVLKTVKAKLSGKKDGKKQRLSGAASKGVAFQELHGDGSRTEAARLFFELLVLQARKQVVLAQEEPYAQISVALQ